MSYLIAVSRLQLTVAQDLASESYGFPISSSQQFFEVEKKSFWFRSRKAKILWALQNYASEFMSLLKIGDGTGFVLNAMADRIHDSKATGSEICSNDAAYTARRCPQSGLVQLDVLRPPYKEEFDVIAAF
jgi:hypothetical protein